MKKHSNLYLALLLGLVLSILIGCSPTPAPIPTATPVPTISVTQTPTVIPTKVFPTADIEKGTAGNPWWNDAVFYEIFVRSFYDSNGDGIGDFNGITAKLDYLKSLGVSGLWLMPIYPSPSYHGYDVTDYYGVNKDYGTMEDFKNLLSEAHKRGIRIVLDLVLNHTSSEHPWFVDAQDPASKYRNWYVWSDTDPGYLGPWGEQVWYPTAHGYYYAVFWEGMPDLNYKNPDVTKEMDTVVKFWLDLGVDGFRLDGAKHLIEEGKTQENSQSTHNWFKSFRTMYKAINPQAMTVGEVWSSSYAVKTYLKGDELDLAFDFDLASAVIDGVSRGDADKLMSMGENEANLFKTGQIATFLTNHDQDRMMSQLKGNVSQAKAAATFLLTSLGVPFIYYGEEIGMTGQKPDEKIRTPMQWSGDKQAGFTSGSAWESVNGDVDKVNVAVEDKDPTSLLNHYRQLIQIRNQHPALRIGSLIRAKTENSKVYASLRVTNDEVILTIINLSDQPVSDYKLSFSGTGIVGESEAHLLFGDGNPAALKVDDSGNAVTYQPIAELPANANLLIQFSK